MTAVLHLFKTSREKHFAERKDWVAGGHEREWLSTCEAQPGQLTLRLCSRRQCSQLCIEKEWSAFAVEVGPLAGLDKVGPVERMQLGVLLQHVELHLAQSFTATHSGFEVLVIISH